MYPRIVKVRDRHGNALEYVRLVESYREGDRVKQRTVANLGRRDLLSDHLERIVELVRGTRDPGQPASLLPQDGEVTAPAWGTVLAARHLWTELGLDEIIRRHCSSSNRKYDIADLAFVLVSSRLCAPSSEHALAWWLERTYVCDRRGRRFLPEWKQRRRVRVDFKQLNLWYRTIDRLLQKKEEIEKAIYLKLRDLFSLKVDVAFYDLTSTYFEGAGPDGLAHHGYSRDHRPREKQIIVGVVMANGWPIAHHVFRGNLKDQQTVKDVLRDLRVRFGLQSVTFVGDRGMVSKDVLSWLEHEKIPYLVGLQRRRSPRVFEMIKKAQGTWIPCPLSHSAREKNSPPRTDVQEVPGDDESRRLFVVRSDERLEYEREQRERAMKKTEEALEALRKQVAEGRIKKPEAIGAKAQVILSRNHGHRYFGWKLGEDGAFQYFEHPVHLDREKTIEGKYVLMAWNLNVTPVAAVETYKALSEVERGFRNLKDVIELRPVYHQTPWRVRGHVFIAALSFLLYCALERLLRQGGVDLGGAQAMDALETVRVVEFEVGGRPHQIVTRPSSHAAAVLQALGVKAGKPPRADQAPAAAAVVPRRKRRS